MGSRRVPALLGKGYPPSLHCVTSLPWLPFNDGATCSERVAAVRRGQRANFLRTMHFDSEHGPMMRATLSSSRATSLLLSSSSMNAAICSASIAKDCYWICRWPCVAPPLEESVTQLQRKGQHWKQAENNFLTNSMSFPPSSPTCIIPPLFLQPP